MTQVTEKAFGIYTSCKETAETAPETNAADVAAMAVAAAVERDPEAEDGDVIVRGED